MEHVKIYTPKKITVSENTISENPLGIKLDKTDSLP